MEAKGQTSKEYFTILTVIHAMLVIGQIVFLAVVYYLSLTLPAIGPLSQTDESLNEVFQFIVPAFIIGGLVASYIWNQHKLKTLREKSDLKDKLAEYRTMLIIKYAILEGPSLFALVSFLLTGNDIFLALSGIIIIYFVIMRPTRGKAGADLELNRAERDQIENPNAIVTILKQSE